MADEDLEQCEDVFEVEKILDVTKDEVCICLKNRYY